MSLPVNVNFCNITGRFIRAVGDSADEGREPDGVPIPGLSIVFTTSLNPPVVRSTYESVTIIIDSILCTTDESGYLVGPDGSQGVLLIASDDADLSPHGWTWTATISGPTVPPLSTTFIAPVDGNIDLTTLVPVPANPGEEILVWQGIVNQVTEARDEILTALEDITEGAPGPQGEQGEPGPQGLDGEPGASAYEIAVANGFVGDEEAWLESLKGADGEDGAGSGSSTIEGVEGLQDALDGKAAVSHTHTASDVTDFATEADARITASTTIVKTSGNQTVGGVKTFSSSPVVPDSSFTVAKTTGLQSALDGKATSAQGAKADSAVQSGNSTITGIEYYPTVEDLPSPGVVGVLYIVN